MTDVASQLAATAAATARLLDTLDTLDDRSADAPSLLPGWNRAQVFTHLARNADGFAAMYAAARKGVVAHQYPEGPTGRAADIDSGRHRPAARVASDLRASVRRLATEAERLRADEWDLEGEVFAGRIRLRGTLPARRREVEVHHVDLGLAYGPDDWPADFVSAELTLAAAGLPARLEAAAHLRLVTSDGMEWDAAGPGGANAPVLVVTGPAGQLLAWLLGRRSTLQDLPALRPWQ